ncbi:ribonuclease H-like domain-containing protein [Tanacetum coccineum]
MVPRTVLTRSGPISLNTARPVNTVQPRTAVNNAGPIKIVINNAYSTAKRSFNKITTTNNSNFTKKVNIVKGTRVNTARPKAVLSVVKGNKGNVVKASAYWVWRPKQKVLDHVSRNNDYEEINGGFVAFRGNSKGGKITGKDFKLTDESYVLLKVPKKDNMYSVDLKNVVPQGGIENLIDLKVKVIRCDNRTEFKNRVMNQFYEMKGIKREFSVARTPQKNGVAERKNRTLIEATRTMLADSKLPTTFWAEAVNTACYVQNRVLVIKPHNKTPYELLLGYSTNSKAFRVFNTRTRIVEENLHVQFSENTPNIVGSTKACDDVGKARMETVPGKDYILLPVWPADLLFSSSSKDSPDDGFKPSGEEDNMDTEDPGNEDSEVPSTEEPRVDQEKDNNINSTNNINTASNGNNTNNVNAISSTVNATGIEVNAVDPKSSIKLPDDPNMTELEDIVYSDDDDVGAEADMNN